MILRDRYDVVILGAGLAGLSLARQLLLDTDRSVLLLERRGAVPPAEQKVGEATVQLSGYYFSKVLDLEQHLLEDHLMKYNLRFYWKAPGRRGDAFEDFSQGYIRTLSNVASYQLDRNVLEAELLARCSAEPRFAFVADAGRIEVDLGGEDHVVGYRAGGRPASARAGWVVDATGRARLLAKRLGLERPSPIRHGASFAWVEGTVDIEKLTRRSRREIRLAGERAAIGHLPFWLATNHFCGEGFWFWVIPLRGKTSLGLVYDRERISSSEVGTPEKLLAWACREFPLFALDLPRRRLVHGGAFRSFSYGCARTLSPERWALTGEAGRFLDPLYSPGGDFIALHNTLIVDAIETADPAALAAKCELSDRLLRALFEGFLPGYTTGYVALGDPEVFLLKYGWELAVYFAFYVFPFLNDLFTDRRFVPSFLKRFGRLGAVNRGLQEVLAGYYRWKSSSAEPPAEPVFSDFTDLAPLAWAERTFYRVGLDASEARRVLDEQLAHLELFARFIAAHVTAVAAGDPGLLRDRRWVEAIDLDALAFDAAELAARRRALAGPPEPFAWPFDPGILDRFRGAGGPAAPEVSEAAGGGRP